jgi:hypothetical protein
MPNSSSDARFPCSLLFRMLLFHAISRLVLLPVEECALV